MKLTLGMTMQLSASSSKNILKHELPAEHLSLVPNSETIFFFQHPAPPHSRRGRFRQHFRQHFRSLISFLTHASEPAEQLAVSNETNKKEGYLISEELFSETFNLDENKIFVPRHCSCHELPKSQVPMSQQTLDANTMYSELLDSSVMELPGTPYVAPRYAELPAATHFSNMASTYSQSLTVHTVQAAALTPTVPSLSPHSASEDQSPVSPFTPRTTDDIPESTPVRNSDTVPHNECYETQAQMRESYGRPVAAMTADQSVQYFNPSFMTSLGDEFGFDSAQRELLGFERSLSALDPQVALVQTHVQRAATLPLRMPVLRPISFKSHDPRIGTWYRHSDATWSRCKEAASTLCTDDDKSSGHVEHIDLSHDHEDHNMMELESEEDDAASHLYPQPTAAKKKREKKYALVYCKHCDKRYSGQYARGNMKRHVLLKHTLKMGRKFKCSMCNKAYNRSDARRNHERSKHLSLGHKAPVSRSASSAQSAWKCSIDAEFHVA
ncbi:hypothetical protein E8E11_006964 [Didymella keratinophila]|nr:hypothetical protein E8E11_006964 [Didymella keratinophila]